MLQKTWPRRQVDYFTFTLKLWLLLCYYHVGLGIKWRKFFSWWRSWKNSWIIRYCFYLISTSQTKKIVLIYRNLLFYRRGASIPSSSITASPSTKRKARKVLPKTSNYKSKGKHKYTIRSSRQINNLIFVSSLETFSSRSSLRHHGSRQRREPNSCCLSPSKSLHQGRTGRVKAE